MNRVDTPADGAAEGGHFPTFAFADLLTSGLVGQELTSALREHFATIGRSEVFLGVRVAASIWAADLMMAEAERDSVRLDLDAAVIELTYLRRQVEVMKGQGAWLRLAVPPDPAMQGNELDPGRADLVASP